VNFEQRRPLMSEDDLRAKQAVLFIAECHIVAKDGVLETTRRLY
jgi:hypothetical protein